MADLALFLTKCHESIVWGLGDTRDHGKIGSLRDEKLTLKYPDRLMTRDRTKLEHKYEDHVL